MYAIYASIFYALGTICTIAYFVMRGRRVDNLDEDDALRQCKQILLELSKNQTTE